MRVAMISRSTLFSTRGGDTVQIEETAKAIKLKGYAVEVFTANQYVPYERFDLIHFFNIIRPNTIIPHIKNCNKPFVVSTIFVDYREVELNYRGWLGRVTLKLLGKNSLEYLKIIARKVKNGEPILDLGYLFRGHKKSIEYILNRAEFVLPNSDSELKRLQKEYKLTSKTKIIPNAVNNCFIQDIYKEKKEIVLCVARIEPIKNQLNLIRALRNTDIKLKLIGKAAPNHTSYFKQCIKEATENVEFLGELTREEVIEELKQAKVHVLPSWFETTGLSSLEAGAMGCNVVVTKKGDTQEYFKNLVEYAEPDNVVSIKEAIEKALSNELNNKLQDEIRLNYRWEITAEKTIEAYLKSTKE